MIYNTTCVVTGFIDFVDIFCSVFHVVLKLDRMKETTSTECRWYVPFEIPNIFILKVNVYMFL